MSTNRLFVLALSCLVCELAADKWTLDGLYEHVKAKGSAVNVFDPANYLKADTKHSMQASINMIEESQKFGTYFVVLDSISDDYWSWLNFKVDIMKFTEEFIFKLLPELSDRDNTLLIVYSIKDKVYRIRTGAVVRVILPDRNMDYLAGRLKWYLKRARYDEAFLKLFEDLFKTPNYTILIAIGVFVVLFFMFLCYQSRNEKKKVAQAVDLKNNYKTLEELKANGADIQLFIQETCVICLEKLENADKNTKEDADPMKEVFLSCGHNYHSGCLKDWLESHEICPLCRRLVPQEGQTQNDTFHFALFDIQRRRYGAYFTATEINSIITSVDGNIWKSYDRQYGNLGFLRDRGAGGTFGSW